MGGYLKSFFYINDTDFLNEYIAYNFHSKHTNIDTIKIGVIGDSYALRQNYRRSLLLDICGDSIACPVVVRCAGLGGRSSDSLFINLNKKFKTIIEWEPNYCVVFGGTNDVFIQYNRKSQSYYAHNMIEICKYLVNHDIIPIIVEIGDIRLTTTRFSRIFVPDYLQIKFADTYRQALKDSLSSLNILESIIFIPYDSYCKTRSDKFEDIVHLNDIGYIELDKEIASAVKKHLELSLN